MDDTVSRDANIGYNLKCYLPYISDCVDGSHLLQHLTYYTAKEKREINQLMKTSPVEATRKAFDILMQTKEPGVFTALLQSLEDDYPKIVRLLRGDVVKCDENYRKIIELFCPSVVNQIDPIALLLHLRNNDVLKEPEAQEAMAEVKSFGKTRAAFYIISNIHRREENWFKYFLMALIDTGFEKLAEELDEDMVKKIKAQKEFDSANGPLEDESFNDEREHVQTVFQGKPENSKVKDDPPSHNERNITELKNVDTDCLGNHCTYDGNLKIAENHEKAFNNTKLLYENEEESDETLLSHDDKECTNTKSLNVRQQESDETVQNHEKDCTNTKSLNVRQQESDETVLNNDKDCTNTKVLDERREESDDIVLNNDKDCTNTKVLHERREESDETVVKKPSSLVDRKREAVEHTDDSSEEQDEFDDDIIDFNELDKFDTKSDHDDNSSRNILTDTDEILNVPEHEIDLRGYQRKLARKGCEGENVIIMAPTNSGKTNVACQIVLSVFKRCETQQGKKGKAVFIVDKDELAFQQGKVFEKELPAYRTKVVTGDVQQNKDQHLKDYVNRRDVLVVTAQVLLNWLQAKNTGSNLNMFDIIVFDECHHTDKKHPYKKIMDTYFEQKLRNAIYTTQVIGLTASIGVGGKLDKTRAFENMKQIAANLDAKALCTVDDEADQAEMKEFLNDPDEKTLSVPRRQIERFYADILETVEKIDRFMMQNSNITQLKGDDSFMRTLSRVPTSHVGAPQFQTWLSNFQRGLAVLESDSARQRLSPCLRYLEQYHLAVMIYNDARIKDALRSLKLFVDERCEAEYNNEADKFLLRIFDDLKSKSYKEEPENPKLLKLKELILNTLSGDENARGIIFVKTRALAKILKIWMHKTDELKELNANAFLGQVKSSGEDGMTRPKQKDVLILFRNGRHRLIIATTVAEEGLDITQCNLVINYEHVTNETARVQRRGRARAPNSKYYVLTEKGSSLIEKEEFNARCEKLMNELIPVLKNYLIENGNTWEDEILQKQRYAKEVRETQSRLQQAMATDDVVNLHCGNCGSFICSSDDVKIICGMHRIVIADIDEKIVLAHSLKPCHVDKTHGVALGGNTFCSNKMCVFKHKIGGIVQYKSMTFPALSIKNICIKSQNGTPLPPAKQWSKVAFKVESMDIEELALVMLQKLDLQNDSIQKEGVASN